MAGRNLLAGAPKGRDLLAPQGGDKPYIDWRIPTPFGEIPVLSVGRTKQGVFGTADESLGERTAGGLAAAGQQLDDRVRSAANAITFNMADRAAAEAADITGVGGAPTAQGQFAATDAARARTPEHVATDVAAALATMPTKGIGYLGSKLGTIPSLLGYGAEGALASGTSEYVRSQDLQKAKEAAETGALWGVGGAAVGNVAGNVGKRLFPKGYQTTDAVEQAAKERWQAAEAANAQYGPGVVSSMLQGMERTAKKHRAGAYVAPQVQEEIAKIRTAHAGKPIEAVELDKVGRQVTENLAELPANRAVAHDLRRDVERAAGSTTPLQMSTGLPRPDVPVAITEGGKLSGQAKRAAELEKAQANAKFQSKQGRDWEHTLENQRRQKLKPILDKVEESVTGSGWSQAQRNKLASIVNGTRSSNFMRGVARLTRLPHPLNLVSGALSLPLNIATSTKLRELNEMIRNGTDVTDRALAERLRSAGGRTGTVYGSQ